MTSTTADWRLTAIGLKIVFWCMLVLLAVSTLARGLQFFAPLADDSSPLSPMIFAHVVSSWVTGIVGLTAYVGLGMCCTAPDEAARRWIVINLVAAVVAVLTALVLAVSLGATLFRMADAPQVLAQASIAVIASGLVMLALLIVAFVAWIMFHVAIARTLGDARLRRLALVNLAAWPAFVVLTVGFALFVNELPGLDALERFRLQAGFGMLLGVVQFGLLIAMVRRTVRAIELEYRL